MIHGYSVQKLAVATAVLHKIDRGELTLGSTVELSERSAGYFRSAEGREGVAAFREKRPAAWVPGTQPASTR